MTLQGVSLSQYLTIDLYFHSRQYLVILGSGVDSSLLSSGNHCLVNGNKKIPGEQKSLVYLSP